LQEAAKNAPYKMIFQSKIYEFMEKSKVKILTKPDLPKGYVHVYTGEGKGKSTAALGLALRASGHNFKVCIVQFMKGSDYSGEYNALKHISNITLHQFGKECPYSKMMKKGMIKCNACRECFASDKEEFRMCQDGLEFAKSIIDSDKFDLIILDEINVAMHKGLVDKEEVLNLIKNKRSETELVLTGRHAPYEIMQKADLITEMKKIKHYFDNNFQSSRGIEY